jgi:hypothetical protein
MTVTTTSNQRAFAVGSALMLTAATIGCAAQQKKPARIDYVKAIKGAEQSCRLLLESKLRAPLKVDMQRTMQQVKAALQKGLLLQAKKQADELAYSCESESKARDDALEVLGQLRRKGSRGSAYNHFLSLMRNRQYGDALLCGEGLLHGRVDRCQNARLASDRAPKIEPPKKNVASIFDISALVVKAEKAAEARPVAETGRRGDPKKLWGWISVGVGGALLATGALMGGLASSDHSSLSESCPKDCPQSTIDRGKTFALTADVMFGLSTAALITGGVLLYLHYDGSNSESATTTSGKKTSDFSASLSVTPTGISLGGRF